MTRPEELKATYQDLKDKRDLLAGDREQIQNSIDEWKARLAETNAQLADIKGAMDALDAAIPDNGASSV